MTELIVHLDRSGIPPTEVRAAATSYLTRTGNTDLIDMLGLVAADLADLAGVERRLPAAGLRRESRFPVNYLSLFSGIGGLDLGLDRAGMTCVGQVELDPWCRTVLTKHWPEVPKHDDVRTAPDWWATGPRPAVRLVAGGFPCQPFSSVGRRRGTADERWGWPWMADVIRAVRPRYVLVENVADLLRDADAFGYVLGDLVDLGFDAEWSVLSACAVGAPHRRRRLYLVAYATLDDGQHNGARRAGATRVRPQPGRGSGTPRRLGWLPEPSVDRVAHGIPRDVVRPQLHALGNSVVPVVVEHIGRLILDHAAAVTS